MKFLYRLTWADIEIENSSAHLPYLQVANGKYAITALCNSSVAAAEAAIKAFNLPSSIKAYGNPQDLANDEDVNAPAIAFKVIPDTIVRSIS